MKTKKKKKLPKAFYLRGEELYKHLEEIGYPSLVKLLKLFNIK